MVYISSFVVRSIVLRKTKTWPDPTRIPW